MALQLCARFGLAYPPAAPATATSRRCSSRSLWRWPSLCGRRRRTFTPCGGLVCPVVILRRALGCLGFPTPQLHPALARFPRLIAAILEPRSSVPALHLRMGRRHGAPLRQGALGLEDDLREMMPAETGKLKFPTGDELAETVAVTRVLAAATGALTIDEVCRHFTQGRQIEKRVALTVQALARLGQLSSPDGFSYVFRQVVAG